MRTLLKNSIHLIFYIILIPVTITKFYLARQLERECMEIRVKIIVEFNRDEDLAIVRAKLRPSIIQFIDNIEDSKIERNFLTAEILLHRDCNENMEIPQAKVRKLVKLEREINLCCELLNEVAPKFNGEIRSLNQFLLEENKNTQQFKDACERLECNPSEFSASYVKLMNLGTNEV